MDPFLRHGCRNSRQVLRGTQTAFLKLYDWRFAEQLRHDQDVKPCTSETEREYADFVLSGDMEEFCHSLEEENIRETDDDWSAGQKEAFLAFAALRPPHVSFRDCCL
jgi:hypothetical protein